MKKLLLLLPVLLAGAFLLSTTHGQAQTPVPQPYPTGQYPAQITLESAAELEMLYRLNIDIGSLRAADGTFHAASDPFEMLIAIVYVTPGQAQALADAGLTAVPIPNEKQPGDWPTFDQFVTRMQGITGSYPNLVRMTSIGKSVLNRDIWCLKITDNPDAAEDEPEVKYSAAIHGDELTGIEMIMRLAELLTESYGNNAYLTSLVDGMEIWLCPITNPDGYVATNRYNNRGVDINRDFPDRFLDPVDDPTGHEPETQAFMLFGYDHRFVMGANLHGGSEVVNYPWDAVTDGDPVPPIPIPSPDDNLFHNFSVGYASRNPYLWDGPFPEGVTRGWEWYQIWRGMQDWAYLWRGEHHVTIELTTDKNPPYSTMGTQWDANREAMIWWMSRALTGVRGRVTAAESGAPLDAVVQVQGMGAPNSVRTDPQAGDYHRVIDSGTYTLTASAACYQDATAAVTVTFGVSATVQDFQLLRAGWTDWNVEGLVNEYGSGRPLTATVELAGAGLVTATNPLDGSYAFNNVCGGTYTLRVSATGYQVEEREIALDHDQVQNFSLHPNSCIPGQPGDCPEPPSGLYTSEKQASTSSAAPGEVVTYTVALRNTWEPATETLTDTLPASLAFSGYLTATLGTPVYANGTISWQGLLTTSETATITYTAMLSQCLAAGAEVVNPAQLTDGLGAIITRTATVTVENLAPSIPQALAPADAAVDVPVSTLLSWQTVDPNCDGLIYSLAFGTNSNPSIVATGFSIPSFDPVMLQPKTTYYWFVAASDGTVTVTSPTWSFTTGDAFTMFLPVINK